MKQSWIKGVKEKKEKALRDAEAEAAKEAAKKPAFGHKFTIA